MQPSNVSSVTMRASRSLKPEDIVITPSGREARVLRLLERDGQEIATIEWIDGDSCDIQVHLLKRVP